jgi:RNA polymerase sigma-70 factor (ECF subfamily)
VARYGPKIYDWCRRWDLPDADAEDVTQNVLLRLARKMETFVYDPARSFRAWLKTLTHHAWRDYVADREQAGRGSADSSVDELLNRVEARDDLMTRLNAEFDHELLDEAMARVRLRVEARTWEAFRLTALEGLSGTAAAEQLGIPVMTVFKYKNRVQKMIQEVVRRLDGPAEEEL